MPNSCNRCGATLPAERLALCPACLFGAAGAFELLSEIGEGPSVFWHAFTTLAPGLRVVFRPCGESEGYTVCASDNVLWTP